MFIKSKRQQSRFINGKIPKPEKDYIMYDDWEGCNLIIMPLLINSMEPWIGDGLLTLMMDGKILNCGQNRSIEGQSNMDLSIRERTSHLPTWKCLC